MPYGPQQQSQSGQMLGAGLGQGLNRAIRVGTDQIQNPNDDLMTSVLRAYGFKPAAGAALSQAGAAGAAGGAAGAAGGGGLMAGLSSL